uniref:Uncharacterized protein n=1 Tax=Glossina brevipalpis TaxID=37001 RepID=A0A1A9X1Y4_9MUSC
MTIQMVIKSHTKTLSCETILKDYELMENNEKICILLYSVGLSWQCKSTCGQYSRKLYLFSKWSYFQPIPVSASTSVRVINKIVQVIYLFIANGLNHLCNFYLPIIIYKLHTHIPPVAKYGVCVAVYGEFKDFLFQNLFNYLAIQLFSYTII